MGRAEQLIGLPTVNPDHARSGSGLGSDQFNPGNKEPFQIRRTC